MKRYLPWILLLLSLGVNVGLVGVWVARELRGGAIEGTVDPAAPSDEQPTPESETEATVKGPEVTEPATDQVTEPEVAEAQPVEEPQVRRSAPPREEPRVLEGRSSEPETSGPRPELPVRRLARLADELGLTGAKRQGFIASQRRFFREVQSRRAELERLQRGLAREVLSDEPAPQVMRQRLAEIGQAYARLDAAFVQNVIRSREFLDDGQEKRFLEMLSRMRQRSRPGRARR